MTEIPDASHRVGGDPFVPGIFFGRPWLHTFVKIIGPAMVLGGIIRLILH